MRTRKNRLAEAVLTSTHNLCFEQKYEKYQKILSENFHFLVETFSIYTERKKKRRVNFIPKFHSSLKKFVKYFTMITKRYMYGTKVPNFIGL